MKHKTRFDRVFDRCPGAWVGAEPGSYGQPTGHITVNATRLLHAIAFLRRKRVHLLGTRLSPGEPGGVQIEIAFERTEPRLTALRPVTDNSVESEVRE